MDELLGVQTSNRSLVTAVYEAVTNIKAAVSIHQIYNLKKLRQYKNHFRIKIADDYRIGIIIKGGTVWLVRFGHRNNFYNKFP